jgi:hypothetical protein
MKRPPTKIIEVIDHVATSHAIRKLRERRGGLPIHDQPHRPNQVRPGVPPHSIVPPQTEAKTGMVPAQVPGRDSWGKTRSG